MRRWFFALMAVGVVGCSDTSSVSEPVPEPDPQAILGIDLGISGLTFYKFAPDAFAAAEKSGSFWAVKGQDRELVLRYSDTGGEFLRFRVGANSLNRRPNGTYFATGDSIQISVTVDATGKMKYSFEPSGLRFSSWDPAELTLGYSRADGLNTLVGLPGIYRRDSWLLGWLPLPTVNLFGNTAKADVKHFTDFALALD